MPPPLSLITSLARSGALDRAWTLFVEGGHADASGDPAALAVKGRLLKDRALRAAGPDRTALLAKAAMAYAAADAIAPQPYLLINVATLLLLSGDTEGARDAARQVLARLEGPVAETPYYIAATRAEASLILGDRTEAEDALAEAARHDPDGWADRASTLRQLSLIMGVTAGDAGWLDRYRPPRSLHYAGHLGLVAHGAGEASLRGAADRLIEEEHIGFAYGALAAGADIVIAESLVAKGVELHLYLSTAADVFRAQSVEPLGAVWATRFDALIRAATTVTAVTRITGPHEPLATALASELAMGAAARNARTFESEAIQLLATDPEGGGANTARQGRVWAESGRRHVVITTPRDTALPEARFRPDRRHSTRRLAAMLSIEVAGVEALPEDGLSLLLDRVCSPLAALLQARPALALSGGGTAWLIGHATPSEAVDTLCQVRAVMADPAIAAAGLGLRITCHYALVNAVNEGLAGKAGLIGGDVDLVRAMTLVATPGAIVATEAFASALFAGKPVAIRAEPLGDIAIPSTLRVEPLFALIPEDQ